MGSLIFNLKYAHLFQINQMVLDGHKADASSVGSYLSVGTFTFIPIGRNEPF